MIDTTCAVRGRSAPDLVGARRRDSQDPVTSESAGRSGGRVCKSGAVPIRFFNDSYFPTVLATFGDQDRVVNASFAMQRAAVVLATPVVATAVSPAASPVDPASVRRPKHLERRPP